jgi:two-component system response regulator HydG
VKALVVDDEAPIRDTVAEVLRAEGWTVSEAESAERAFEMLDGEQWALVFCDVKLGGEGRPDGFSVLRRFTKEQPEAQIVLMTGHGSAVGALDATALGAYDYLMKPFGLNEVLDISRSVRRGIEKRLRPGTTGELPPLSVYTSADIDLVGRSAAFVEAMKLVGRVAATNLPVLITGESGTGKEIVARAIHRRSPRASKSFVAVNCGAIPAELIESELFGHVRGSFTGATADRLGLWQEADGGTVLLDEITETTLAFQVKLLRALQEGEIRRVGSNHTLHVNVRVIAATNRDPEREQREGRFRQDLLYRLNAVTLHLPPLRERREDILPLARHFAGRLAADTDGHCVSFSREAIKLLEDYYWPGNIRELENAIIRASALCDQSIRPEDLPERIRNYSQTAAAEAASQDGPTAATQNHLTQNQPAQNHSPAGSQEDYLLPLATIEERHIARVLDYTGGNKQAAARILGIDRTTLQRMLKRHRDGEPGAD